MIRSRLFLVAIVLVAPFQHLSGEDLYGSTDLLEFADHLYETRELTLAELEYQRFLSLPRDAEDRISDEQFGYALWRLSKIGYTQDRYDRGIEWADRAIREGGTEEYRERAYALKIIMMLSLGRWDGADETIRTAARDDLISRERRTVFDVYRYVSRGDYPGALSIIESDLPDTEPQPLTTRLASYDEKRPWLAATYSAVLPGAGRLYTRQFSDGLVSFVLIGALAGVTTYATLTEGLSSWRPWVFGGATVVFYLSEIYGAYRSAERYESRQRQLIERAADGYLETAVP